MSSSHPITSVDQSSVEGFRYIARQPILTADESVFGYELLFRDGVESHFRNPDGEAASRSTLDSSILIGLDVLCDGRRAFLNCTREMLLKDYAMLLPSTQAVVEVLKDVPPDDLVIAACQRLKAAGYQIALDDFSVDDPREPLTGLADIIKVDLRATSLTDAAVMVKRYGVLHLGMLAEKVETREEFVATKKAGFRYFQGYFFQKPQMMQAREIPANRLNYVRLLQLVSSPELDVRALENLIKGETSLCYRLLRYLNSAAFAFSTEIQSVRHALAILGEREVRRWVRLVATLSAGMHKSNELVLSALVRARFCELLAVKLKGDSDFFLLGLLSLMDAILEMPMGAILESIRLDRETKAVLLGQPSPLKPLYELMVAYETGDWSQALELCAKLKISESFAAAAHFQAMQWAQHFTSGV